MSASSSNPAVTSQITPGRPLRLCLSCLRYSWGLEGKGPAKHTGVEWVCKQELRRVNP